MGGAGGSPMVEELAAATAARRVSAPQSAASSRAARVRKAAAVAVVASLAWPQAFVPRDSTAASTEAPALDAADAPEPAEQEQARKGKLRLPGVRFRRGKERKLRNGKEEQPLAVSRQLDQAANYFSNSVRVPAALIAGQAGNMLHRLTEIAPSQRPHSSTEQEDHQSLRVKIHVALWRTHFLLIAYTVCAELTAVLICSTAHAQILDIGREELSLEPTALDLIMRHVEFEYVTVRIAFISGLVTFLLSVAVRSAASLAAGPRRSTVTGRRELLLCAAMGAMLVSTLAWWSHIYGEEAIEKETFSLLWRFSRTLISSSRGCSMALVALLAGALGVVLSVCSLLFQLDSLRPPIRRAASNDSLASEGLRTRMHS